MMLHIMDTIDHIDILKAELYQNQLELGCLLPGTKMDELKDAIELHTKVVQGKIFGDDETMAQRLYIVSRRLINLYYVLRP